MVTGLRASASSARSGWAAMQKSARISETIRVMVIALRWADDGTATSRASLPMGCRSEISLHFFGLDGASGFDRNKGNPKMKKTLVAMMMAGGAVVAVPAAGQEADDPPRPLDQDRKRVGGGNGGSARGSRGCARS